jgi:peptidoglycan/LPS O-acetylase OafA/YrhL
MTPAQPHPRFHEIDLLRGLACAAVVAYHYASRGPRVGWMPSGLPHWLDALSRYGYLGVHLFFIISGFVILMSAQGSTARGFVASRVARLYPAFWVCASLSAGAAWVLAEARFQVSVGTWLANLTLLPHWWGAGLVDGVYWSLLVEMHFYLYVLLTLRLGWLKEPRQVQALLAAWLLVSGINALRPMAPVELWLSAQWAPLFTAGAVCWLMRCHGPSPARGLLFAAAYGLALVYGLREAADVLRTPGQPPLLNPWGVVGVLSAFFALFAAIGLGWLRCRASALGAWLGALTYPVYLLHENLGSMTALRLQAAGVTAAASAGLALLLVLTLAWVVHAGVERRWGHRLRRWVNGVGLGQARQ